ncbi:MAG: hypothetical protein MUE42_01270 [Opitutaceae bacterium]|jgi:hypothetical protein|nr:hypothetical protein [Opitutaceae bacterium]
MHNYFLWRIAIMCPRYRLAKFGLTDDCAAGRSVCHHPENIEDRSDDRSGEKSGKATDEGLGVKGHERELRRVKRGKDRGYPAQGAPRSGNPPGVATDQFGRVPS